MPLVRISVTQNITPEQLQYIAEATHRALVETFEVPPEDRFQVLTLESELIYPPSYLGIAHGNTAALIQITCNEGRSLEMKRALFMQLARSIAAGGAIAASDVIINLVETKKENWSFGNGLAQYAP
ncbi:MAG: 4-oxalocrotonate tautomerase [Myxococcaceae bacterium]|nr:4-oxalocrotonate tautomerase [Myxococcaceae bacterium]